MKTVVIMEVIFACQREGVKECHGIMGLLKLTSEKTTYLTTCIREKNETG